MKNFLKICKMHSQFVLKQYLLGFMQANQYKTISASGYLLCIPKRDAEKILLTAHMDTVHKNAVKNIVVERHEGKTIISSPQGIGGDDRCGVWLIMEIVKAGYRPYVIFCEDEEIGCVGADKFCVSKDLAKLQGKINFIIELDRRNATDAVYYDLDNLEFEEWVTENCGYKTAYGSCSDISYLAPELEVAAVNLSCGYYKEHTLEHYVVFEEMQNTLVATKKLIEANRALEKPFEYIEIVYSARNSVYGYGYGSAWDGYGSSILQIKYKENGEVVTAIEEGSTVEECIGSFLMTHEFMRYSDILEHKVISW